MFFTDTSFLQLRYIEATATLHVPSTAERTDLIAYCMVSVFSVNMLEQQESGPSSLHDLASSWK